MLIIRTILGAFGYIIIGASSEINLDTLYVICSEKKTYDECIHKIILRNFGFTH